MAVEQQVYDATQQRKLIEAQQKLAQAQGSGGTQTGGVPPAYNPLGPLTGTGITLPSAGGPSSLDPGQSLAQNVSTSIGGQQSTGTNRAVNFSQSYIPEYSQTPILEEIAKYSRDMAPKVYQWGMDQFNRNQGNIDTLMRNALSYASPQRIAASMGQAEAGVQQGAEAGRQSAIRDLQSFGIDPSSGRYAALDTANRVMAGASAAGAGNQQRMADIAQGNTMANQAISSGLSNVQTGYGAAGAANALLGTASNLKYSPLGTASGGVSTGDQQSSGYNLASASGYNAAMGYDPNSVEVAKINADAAIKSKMASPIWQGGTISNTTAAPFHGGVSGMGYAEGGAVDDDATTGGFVSQELSPSNGNQVDDVEANLNAGEFVIPKDVAAWKGQEFFYKLMAQARKMRATAGNGGEMEEPQVGYGAA